MNRRCIDTPVGSAAGGGVLADWFISPYETQSFHWHLDMQTTKPLIVAAAVFTAALTAQVPAFRAIRRIDVAKSYVSGHCD